MGTHRSRWAGRYARWQAFSQASEVALDVALDEVERLSPRPGQATVTGRASRDGAEAPWSLDLRVTAPRDITASVIGTTAAAGSTLASMPTCRILAPWCRHCPARMTGAWSMCRASGWPNSRQSCQRTFRRPLQPSRRRWGRISYQANVGDVGVFVPQLQGPGQVTGVALSADMAIWNVTAQATLPEDITASGLAL